jgi:hypothetical protein
VGARQVWQSDIPPRFPCRGEIRKGRSSSLFLQMTAGFHSASARVVRTSRSKAAAITD